VIEAVMFWNEPNNKSHWDFEIDPDWNKFADMIKLAADAVGSENSRLTRVLGGISPIDPSFIQNLQAKGALDKMNVVALHGFPLDWNDWTIHEWPDKIQQIRNVTRLPIWISEVGASSFGAEEIQEFGLKRSAELLIGKAPRIHWYSLYDLPKAWPATTRHRETEGSSYYRHFHMGLLNENGGPKRALAHFHDYTPELGICQWFHFEDHRLDNAAAWLNRLGVKYVRTGLSWSDTCRPNYERWFDRIIKTLESFHLTITFCFTPDCEGITPHHTSAPRVLANYADFCARMVRRYAA
jgi:beta-xylosidase